MLGLGLQMLDDGCTFLVSSSREMGVLDRTIILSSRSQLVGCASAQSQPAETRGRFLGTYRSHTATYSWNCPPSSFESRTTRSTKGRCPAVSDLVQRRTVPRTRRRPDEATCGLRLCPAPLGKSQAPSSQGAGLQPPSSDPTRSREPPLCLDVSRVHD